MTANQITGLREFLISWDEPVKAQPYVQLPLVEGQEGQINLRGTSDSPAVIVTRYDPRFEDSLESGIKGLVLCLIKTFDCITYSSCAGHTGADKQLVCGANVGILPRDESEHGDLRFALSSAIREIHDHGKAVRVELDETVLYSDELSMPCLDVNFRPMTADAETYFADLTEMIERLITRLNSAAQLRLSADTSHE